MLVHDYLAITLQHAENLPAFGNSAGAWVDFDVDGPACNLAAGSDRGTSSDGSSDGCHAVIETEVRAWLIESLTGPDKLTTKV